MSAAASARDPYWRRREAGRASREETRRRLLAAADELFRQQGFLDTSVLAIAEHAGVSLQTLYLAWGSKRALLQAATDAAAIASNQPMTADEWHTTVLADLAEDAGADSGAPAYLAAVSRLFVRVAERTAPYWRMLRQAAVAEPEGAAGWEDMVAARRATMAEVAASIPAAGLRPGLTTGAVADTLWALASPEAYDLLTVPGGYSPAEFGCWLERTLVAALCPDR